MMKDFINQKSCNKVIHTWKHIYSHYQNKTTTYGGYVIPNPNLLRT